MNDQVKELIAMRDEYLALVEEMESHGDKEIFGEDYPWAHLSESSRELVKEYSNLVTKKSLLRAKIQNQFLFMIDHIEKLEEYIVGADEVIHNQKDTIAEYQTQVSWYIDETGIYYPGYRDQ